MYLDYVYSLKSTIKDPVFSVGLGDGRWGRCTGCIWGTQAGPFTCTGFTRQSKQEWPLLPSHVFGLKTSSGRCVNTHPEPTIGRAGGEDMRSNGMMMTSGFWLRSRHDPQPKPARKCERRRRKKKTYWLTLSADLVKMITTQSWWEILMDQFFKW